MRGSIGLADHLGDEHAATKAAGGLDRYPRKVIVVNVLGGAEGTRGGLERHQRDAGDVTLRRLGFDDPQAGRQRVGIPPVPTLGRTR